jgi:hypothetical protein
MLFTTSAERNTRAKRTCPSGERAGKQIEVVPLNHTPTVCASLQKLLTNDKFFRLFERNLPLQIKGS